MAKTDFFTQEELNQIASAVQEAEEISGAEIVPVFARQSSFYELALWRAGFSIAAISAICFIMINQFTDKILFLSSEIWILGTLTAGVIGSLLTLLIPPIKRFFAGNHLIEKRVWDKALLKFLDHGVSHTPKRNGLLLFISLFERKIIVLADVGIAESVSQEHWDELVKEYLHLVKPKGLATAISTLIKKSGNVINDVMPENGNTGNNVLGDDLRIDSE